MHTLKNKVYTIGDTLELIFTDGTEVGEVKLDSVGYSLNEDGETCNLGLIYTIYPNTIIHLNEQNIFISCDAEKYYTNQQMNLEKNKKNIFELNINTEIQYAFFFTIPSSPYFDNLENRDEGYDGWGIKCYIENVHYDIYTGIIYDSL